MSALTGALRDLLDQGQRPPCCRSDAPPWWLSDSAEERALAAAMCRGCGILAPCSDEAETYGVRFGVWGARDRTPGQKGRPREH